MRNSTINNLSVALPPNNGKEHELMDNLTIDIAHLIHETGSQHNHNRAREGNKH
jgi:hypothetical protein